MLASSLNGLMILIQDDALKIRGAGDLVERRKVKGFTRLNLHTSQHFFPPLERRCAALLNEAGGADDPSDTTTQKSSRSACQGGQLLFSSQHLALCNVVQSRRSS